MDHVRHSESLTEEHNGGHSLSPFYRLHDTRFICVLPHFSSVCPTLSTQPYLTLSSSLRSIGFIILQITVTLKFLCLSCPSQVLWGSIISTMYTPKFLFCVPASPQLPAFSSSGNRGGLPVTRKGL